MTFRNAVITNDKGETTEVQLRICSTCTQWLSDFSHDKMKKSCLNPNVDGDEQLRVKINGGCRFWKMGQPITAFSDPPEPKWLTEARLAGLDGGRPFPGYRMHVEIIPGGDPDTIPTVFDTSEGWALDGLGKHEGPGKHDNGTPQAVHGARDDSPQAPQVKYKENQPYTHATLGQVTLIRAFQNGRGMVNYPDANGELDFTTVPLSELKPVGGQMSLGMAPAAPARKPTQGWSAQTPAGPKPISPARQGTPADKITPIKGGASIVEIGGKKGIFRPAYDEDDPPLDPTIGGYQFERDIAASKISDALGLDVVPHTEEQRVQTLGPGSMIDFVDGYKQGDKAGIKAVPNGIHVAVLDALTLQAGRFSDAWGTRPDGRAVVPNNGLAFARTVQQTPDKAQDVARSAFQAAYAGQAIPGEILDKVRALTVPEFEAMLPKHIDSGVKEQAVLNLQAMQSTGTIPPVLTDKGWWNDPGKKLSSFLGDFKVSMDKVVDDLKADFPAAEVSSRLKSIESTRRDAAFRKVDAYSLPDYAGTRLVVDNAADQKAAVEALRAKYGDAIWHEAAIGLPEMGSPVNREQLPEGYRAVHMNVKVDGRPVEIQVRTKRQHYLGEYMHDVFTIPELKHDDKFHEYARAMADHYAKLDRGEASTPPKAPWQVKYHKQGAMLADPLAPPPPPAPKADPTPKKSEGTVGQSGFSWYSPDKGRSGGSSWYDKLGGPDKAKKPTAKKSLREQVKSNIKE